ncbi:hypothetical protein BR93DRAFT_967417 [Coniochaeta sp. PMI_546]|nr:hypothetical protein BR93DRAFT_967417 [Coniochaeta sp. PMI_546]
MAKLGRPSREGDAAKLSAVIVYRAERQRRGKAEQARRQTSAQEHQEEEPGTKRDCGGMKMMKHEEASTEGGCGS